MSRVNDPSDDLLQRAIQATLELPTPAGPSAEVMSQALAALEQASSSPHVTFSQRVKHMFWQHKKTSALLAAAASLLAVYLGLSNNNALAFTDIVKALAEVRTATWKMMTETALPDGQIVKSTANGMFLAPSRERIETTTNGMLSIQITDGTKDKTLGLNPATKTAMVIELKNAPANRGSSFSQLSTALRDMAQLEERMRNQNLEHLKTRTIGGVKAEGLRWRFGSLDTEIWVDPETRLPIRVEYKATQPSVHVVMTDFQVNVDIDESLFSIDVPEGYTVQQTAAVDYSKQPITYLADALRLAADFNEGIFPDELRGSNGMDGIIQAGVTKRATELAGDSAALNKLNKLNTEVPMALGGAYGLLFSLSPEANDFHYAGKDVKRDTADQPIFWYKPHKASETYTVLYADLSVKEVPRGQIPTVPATK